MGSSKLQYYFERMEIFLLVDFQSLVGSFWQDLAFSNSDNK